MVLCAVSEGELRITRRLLGQSTQEETPIPRPLFVGHSAVPMPDGSVVVVGGGATCFSMGTCWNKGVYTIRILATGEQENAPLTPRWVHEKTIDIIPNQRSQPASRVAQVTGQPAQIIPRVKVNTAEEFAKLVQKGRPVVLEGLDLGSCVPNWTLNYLVDKVGADRKVSVPKPSAFLPMYRLT